MRTPVPDARSVWRRVRVSAGPVVWAIAAVVILLASYPFGPLRAWHGFLLATPFLLATAGLGWRAGLLLAPAALLLLWLRTLLDGDAPQILDYALILVPMTLATFGGDRLYRVWRGIEQRARQAGRRAKLLQEAAVDLNNASDLDGVFASAARLLAGILPFAHAAVFVPDGAGLRVHSTFCWGAEPGFAVPLASVMGRAYATREAQYVADTLLDPDYVVPPNAEPTRSELALPVMTGQRVRAVLNVEHLLPDAFGAADQATLVAFVRVMEEAIARLEATEALSEARAHQQFLARLNHRLLLAEDVTESAEAALEEVITLLDFDVGAVLELRYAQLRPIAVRGSPPPVLSGLLRNGLEFTGVLRHAWEQRELVLIDDLAADARWTGLTEARTVAIVPIVTPSGQVQALLAVMRHREPPTFWAPRKRALLEAVSTSLGAAFQRATLNRQLFATLGATRQLTSAKDPDALYRDAAKAALDIVPNAEAVSILVRHGDHVDFEAAVGYDLDYLKSETGPFTYEELVAWHGEGEVAFEAGAPRILRGPAIVGASTAAVHTPANKSRSRVLEMRCQLAVPIVDTSGVVALLNVDNFSTEDAFGPAALLIGEAFAQHLTVVVRQAQQMLALERSAVTDALTGLGNRDGFDRAFRQELARARRYEHHLSVVILDLDNFKEVNDRFGHMEGDKVLVAVGQALASAARGTDQVFRWGGDEFALILPEVKPDDAAAVAERLARVLAGVPSGTGAGMRASIGIASYPSDGLERDVLLKAADNRMYMTKRARAMPGRRQSRGSELDAPGAVALPSGATPVNAGRDSR